MGGYVEKPPAWSIKGMGRNLAEFSASNIRNNVKKS
jgi:hypothetical protein